MREMELERLLDQFQSRQRDVTRKAKRYDAEPLVRSETFVLGAGVIVGQRWTSVQALKQ